MSKNPQLIKDPSRVQRGRIGGLRLAATHDSREYTKKARQAFNDKFLKEVDPDGILPEWERYRRADAARRAFFTRLAMRSAEVRRQRRRYSFNEPWPSVKGG